MAANVDWALAYAKLLGWAVLPLHTPNRQGECSCPAGADCRSAGKHPRTQHGVHDATTDPAQIKDWWRDWPDANIGLAAGEPSGVVVIDVDPRNGGVETLQELDPPPHTLTAFTGGGGRHYFCLYTDEPMNAHAGDGIDLQGDGRIVVLAPSLHPSGKHYKWRRKPKVPLKLKPVPDWAVSPRRDTHKALTTLAPTVYHEGGRDNMLISIAGRWRRAGMGEAEILAALRIRNSMWCEPPLDDRDVQRISRSAMRWQTGVEEASAASTQDMPLTDVGNALRLQALHGKDIRYVGALGWLEWDTTRWKVKADDRVMHRAIDVAKGIMDEAVAVNADEKELKRYQAHAAYCGSEPALTKMVKVARTLPGIALEGSGLDADPWLFNVQNGTLNLKTGELHPHSRDDYITKIAPVTYDPDAKAERWSRFLPEIFRGDEDLIVYLQRLFGYCLTGAVTEQVFPIFWGEGQNGKSKLIEAAIPAVMGKDYMVRLTPASLMESRSGPAHPTELMDLRGARLAIAIESSKGKSLDEEIIKRLTGGDTIKARRMHKDPEEFRPTHKLILVTNHKPRSSASPSITRRLRLVPFLYKVPEELKEDDLGEQLEAEASGILNWMLAGCLAWQEEGLVEPEAVTSITSRHMADQDILGMFFNEDVVFEQAYRCTGGELFQAYEIWCHESRVRPMGKISFNREAGDRYPEKRYKSKGIAKWRGMRPRNPVPK